MKSGRLIISALLCLAPFNAWAGELIQDISGEKLAVVFAPKQTRWVIGATVEAEAVITNKDKAALRVDVFGGLNEVYQGKRKNSYIVSCWALVWEPAARPESRQKGKAPLSVEQLIPLKGGEAFAKSFSWVVGDVPPGAYTVRLAYAPRVASPSFNFPEHWLRQQGVAEPIWTGMIFSEPVEIEVAKP